MLHPEIPDHSFQPCPAPDLEGPGGWTLHVARGAWIGQMANVLESMLTHPQKGWPRRYEGEDIHTGRAGVWTVRVCSDGSLIARTIPSKGGRALPLPLVLTSPAYPARTTAKELWAGVDKGWLQAALATIATSLHAIPAVGMGHPKVPANAWALWWVPGRWLDSDTWTRLIDSYALHTCALLGPEFQGTQLRLALELGQIDSHGHVVPARLITDNNLAGRIIARALAPLMTRSGLAGQAWTVQARNDEPHSRPGVGLITPPGPRWSGALPTPSGHAILAATHSPAWKHLRAAATATLQEDAARHKKRP